MVTWRTIQRYLRQAGIDSCFLAVSADPDFDPDAEFPFNRTVFAAFLCSGRYVRLHAQAPVIRQIIRRAGVILLSQGYLIDIRDTYDDGIDLRIVPEAAKDSDYGPLLDFRKATIKRCRPKDRDEDRPAKDQVWCLYTKDGDRLLGRHPTKEKANRQERAIQIRKHS